MLNLKLLERPDEHQAAIKYIDRLVLRLGELLNEGDYRIVSMEEILPDLDYFTARDTPVDMNPRTHRQIVIDLYPREDAIFPEAATDQPHQPG